MSRAVRRPAFDVVGLGTSSIDQLCRVARHPRLDSKQPLVEYDVQPGGQVPTALVALQRWGARTAWVGALADDPGGRLAHEALLREGVDVRHVVSRSGQRQPVSVILIDEVTGERSVLWQPAPGFVLGADELPAGILDAGRVLLMDAVDPEASLVAARQAKAAGACVVLDVDTPGPGIRELLAFTDVLITAAEFPLRLTGRTDIRSALRMCATMGPRFVAATLGPGGALAFVGGQMHYAAPCRVVAIDSTGAGDIFHAGCIHGLLHGWPTEETLRFAAAAAALKCERLGGRAGIPTVDGARRKAGLAAMPPAASGKRATGRPGNDPGQ